MKIKELKIFFQETLSPIYNDNQEVESFFNLLVEHFHQMKRIDISLNPDFIISENELESWKLAIDELKNEKPIQYIIGSTWFYGLKFEVNEHTLIPRPETEELVSWLLESVENKQSEINVIDIGTGTGCIPISVKTELKEAKVFAIDISEKALKVANKNAENNNTKVNFILQNILELNDLNSLPDFTKQFDIIVSNPPYVRHLEKQEIKKNVLDYEPHLALFVEDDDALLFYRKIAQLALINLKPNGYLFFEINQYLGKETVELLQQLGFINIILKKDIYGNDRMIRCSKN